MIDTEPASRPGVPPRISLVVATAGTRSAELRRMLDSARCQTRTDFEVIVVDQSGGALDALMGEYPEVLHIHSHQLGLSRNRNLGIAAASGSVITFPDDDCVLPTTYVDHAAALGDRFSGTTLFGFGDVLQLETGEPFHERYRVGSIRRVTAFNCFKIPSVGLVVDRRAFARSGTFDERFGVGATYGAAEEADLMLRMLALGLEGIYEGRLQILHPARPKREVSIERHRSYSEALGALARKHWREARNWRFLLVYLMSVLRSLGGIAIALTVNSTMTRVYATNLRAKVRGFLIYHPAR